MYDYLIVGAGLAGAVFARCMADRGRTCLVLEKRNHIHKYEKENNCQGGGKAEDKFLALGSPKFDKVLSTRREDVTVPPEWESLMIKEDKSRKKVVLYNTTVDALLKKSLMWKRFGGFSVFFMRIEMRSRFYGDIIR